MRIIEMRNNQRDPAIISTHIDSQYIEEAPLNEYQRSKKEKAHLILYMKIPRIFEIKA